MKVLAIGAHMDDFEIGCGATIAQHVLNGDEVYGLIITDSCSAGHLDGRVITTEDKKEMCEKASKILGIKKVFYGSFPDMKLDMCPHVEVNHFIEEIVNEIKPDVVYTHRFGDVNMDHELVCRSSIVACRNLKCEILMYDIPFNYHFPLHPLHFEASFKPCSGRCIEIKKKALYCYLGELTTEKINKCLSNFELFVEVLR